MSKIHSVMAAGVVMGLLVTGAASAQDVVDIRIDGRDAEWHTLSTALKTNQCYEINLGSTVKYAPSDTYPSVLKVVLRGAHSKEYSYKGKGGNVIGKTIKFQATSNKLEIRLGDPNPADNSGRLQVGLRPCQGK